MNICDVIDAMKSYNRTLVKLKSIQYPKPMPKTYQKSKSFRNQKTLRKK